MIWDTVIVYLSTYLLGLCHRGIGRRAASRGVCAPVCGSGGDLCPHLEADARPDHRTPLPVTQRSAGAAPEGIRGMRGMEGQIRIGGDER